MEQIARAIKDLQKRVLFLEHLERPISAALGASAYRRAFVAVKVIPDNVATTVATITTTNETGATDAGGYSVKAHLLIFDGSSGAADTAVKGLTAQWARTMEDAGTGVNTAVTEIHETAVAATTPAQATLGTVTISLTEISEYQIGVQVLADHQGALASALTAILLIDLLWYGFLTPPVIAAA